MINEYPFRLRPRRPRYQRDESKLWARGFQQLMHLVRMTGRSTVGGGPSAAAKKPSRRQRCAIRLTYSSNKVRGQWAAHGRYVERESAATASFGSAESKEPMSKRLGEWQKAGDERLFKLVISPEFGDRLDLEQLTREVMGAIERDVGSPLEWTAVVHRNTEHPHVHVALRGVADGRPLRFARDYVKHHIRHHAEEAATRQLGYRTALDIEEAERREIASTRFTSLDRIISGQKTEGVIRLESNNPLDQRIVARLNFLTEIGLAEPIGPMRWRLRQDFESALRAFQRAQDRQRSIADHATLLSDSRLKFRVVRPERSNQIAGRVITHVLDDVTQQPHALVEGIDGVVYYLPHGPGLSAARANGQAKPDSFVILAGAGEEVEDFGDAKNLLNDRHALKSLTRRLAQRGLLPDQSVSWSGWLGEFQRAAQSEIHSPEPGKPPRALGRGR